MQDVNNVIQGSESAFRADEYAQRIQRTRERLSRAGVDVMIVTGPENIFWLTGQQTPGYYTFQALLLPVEGDPVFVIRQLEYFNFIANTFISDAAIYQDGDNPVDFLVGMLQQRGWLNKRIGLDKRGWFLPIAVYEALQAKLGTIADTAGVIEPLRAVKSAAEVEKIALAARYVDAGMRAGMAAIGSGADENALVSAMMGAAIAAGSEYVGMEPLVSTGPRSGVPHGTWRRRVMQDNDPVFLEMSAAHDRYHAAMMRSAWLGRPPAIAIEMEKVCQEALQAALDAIRPGATCEAPHLACQKVIDRAGFTENFKNAPVTPSVSPSRRTGAKAAFSVCTAASPPSCSLA